MTANETARSKYIPLWCWFPAWWQSCTLMPDRLVCQKVTGGTSVLTYWLKVCSHKAINRMWKTRSGSVVSHSDVASFLLSLRCGVCRSTSKANVLQQRTRCYLSLSGSFLTLNVSLPWMNDLWLSVLLKGTMIIRVSRTSGFALKPGRLGPLPYAKLQKHSDT